MVTYFGVKTRKGGAQEVWKRYSKTQEVVILFPKQSLKLRDHSPDGFQWGYGGSGPAQLALALLLDATGDARKALRYYQQFKDEYVALWPDRWEIPRGLIREWVKVQEEAEGKK